MTRLLLWLGKLMIGAIIVSAIAIVMTWLTVRSYVDKILSGYAIQVPELRFADLVESMSGGLVELGDEGGAGTKGAAGGEQTSGREESKGGSGGGAGGVGRAGAGTDGPGGTDGPSADGTGGTSGRKGSTGENGEDAVPAWTAVEEDMDSAASRTDRADDKTEVVMSTEQLNEKKKEMTEADKLLIFNVLMNRLPPNEMQELSVMAENGITAAEWETIRKIIEHYVKPEEYEQLMNILNKYR